MLLLRLTKIVVIRNRSLKCSIIAVKNKLEASCLNCVLYMKMSFSFVSLSGKKKRKASLKRSVSRYDVGNQARLLLCQFVHDRMEADGFTKSPSSDTLVETGTPSGRGRW